MLPLRALSRVTRKFRVIAALVVAGLVLATAACGGHSSSGPSAKATTTWTATPGASTYSYGSGLGFYDGKFSPKSIETTAKWLGSAGSVKFAQDFIDASSWSKIATPWQLPNWKGSPYTMIWGVPMLPCGGSATQCATNVSDYNLVAGGGADKYYKTLAKNLVAAGFGTSYIRLGWEFNASWMGWSVCNGSGSGLDSWSGDFVPAFRNIVTAMRSVTGANFKFIWNPLVSSNTSCPGGNLEKFYPGDKYVDTVALDIYDGVGQSTSDTSRWNDLLKGVNGGNWTSIAPESVSGQGFKGYGLDWLTAFGKEHGKEISIPEWGIEPTSNQSGGGDDPYFITQMAQWIKANASGPALFWNYGDGTLPLDVPGVYNGKTPKATAAFKAAFG